jgi:hypothetical protein
MDLTGVNITLNNSGTLDPALLGLVSVLSGGAFIGTGAASTVNVKTTPPASFAAPAWCSGST